ncbi:MAG: hydrogenase nickel incorporation protein HypB [Methylohalobius sp.]|nr:hydrogenase nickel incorporation protein HypB [Methylohalobius sp.]
MCESCGCSGEHPHLHQSTLRRLQVEENLLAVNDRYAQANRKWLAERGIQMINFMASPGAGKTSLLVKTLTDLAGQLSCAVIEGDQQTSLDAERIRACGIPAVQVNTGKSCHLDAHQVGHALVEFDLPTGAWVFIENVGNLVCPAGFDLGESKRVVLLSVTEGDDKPLKYPYMFHRADLVLVTKIDLLPYVDFDLERCTEHARRLRPEVEVFALSAKSGEGMAAWYAWLRALALQDLKSVSTA